MKTLRTPLPPLDDRLLAVVMASLCTGRGVLDVERLSSSMRVLRHSPFGVKETLRRIEQAAEARGLQVLARVGQQGRSSCWPRPPAARRC